MGVTGVTLDPGLVKLAMRIAHGFMRRLPWNVTADDVQQAALIGVLSAVRRHPHGSGHGFECYVACRVRGEILDELRRQDWSKRRNRVGKPGVPTKVVRFDDISETWGDLFEGESESAEALAIARIDADKAWQTPMRTGDRRIMTARFQRGRRQKDVALDEGVSEPRISQLEARALLAMKSHLTGAPPSNEIPLAQRRELWQARAAGGKR